MNHLYNSKDQLLHRRSLRTDATLHGRIMWARLRGEQFGVRFRRQFSVDRYILDFYCPKLKLAIEIDGAQHLDHVAYDDERTKFLAQKGVFVLRFGNNEVNSNLEGVVTAIELTIRDLIDKVSTPSQPSPG